MIICRTYSELSRFKSFKDRFEYLKLFGKVGAETFGHNRYLNQVLYRDNPLWKKARRDVLLRDNACDLGIADRPISGRVIIHHMNPITEDDIISGDERMFDPEFLICVSFMTHNAIHYGDEHLLIAEPEVRMPGDTSPWRC